MRRSPTFKPHLATENGRRVGKVPKSKRLAAQPATDAARLSRSLEAIYAEGCHALDAAQRAEKVAELSFFAGIGAKDITATALGREEMISAGYVANRISNLLQMIESARDGTLCA